MCIRDSSITPSKGVEASPATVELPPSYGAGATAADMPNVTSIPSQNSAATDFANFLGSNQLANIEKGIGGLANLGGQIASTVKNVKQGTSGGGGGTQPTPRPKPTASPTILGVSPVVFIGGLVVVGLITGVGIYLATRSGGEGSAAPAGKGKGK